MNLIPKTKITLTLLAVAALAACSTTPADNMLPGQARTEYRAAQAGAETDRMRLAARTQEADAATAAAGAATRDAAAATREAEASQRQAAMLETQLREMNARQTDRGMVVTIGDVLFDSGQSALRSGSLQSLQRLGGFLKECPQRKALIEGYTDSVGSDGTNIALSTRRAEAVKGALLGMGVQSGQLAAQGYGEAHPVAGNDNAGGRQANRRVEIVLSDENGALKSR